MNPLKSLAALDPAKKTFSLVEEFKAFAFKGNVIDLAIGVIIGAAFGKIVESLVKDVFMPVIALVSPGSGGYETWEWRGIHYGTFIAQIVNFLIIALALFLFVVKFLGWIMKSKKQEIAAPPPPTREQELLVEIRDLLKKQQAPAASGG